jgi:hypothetical protein
LSKTPKGSTLKIVQKALEKYPLPNDIESVSKYITDVMRCCKEIAKKQYNITKPNRIGRMNGDWFEYLVKHCLTHRLGKENITVFPGRGHHIKEIMGFEKVTWIPMPDAIVKNVKDLRAVLTLKWGLRHDRMYEVGYEAYAIKDWIEKNKLPPIKVFLLENDNDSGYESRLEIMSKVPPLDAIYYLEHEKLPPKLQKIIKSIPDLIRDLKHLSSNT